MNDLKSRITIEDDFSESLKELSKQTIEVSDNIDDLTESLEDMNDVTQDQTDYTDDLTDSFKKLPTPLENIKKRLVEVSTNSARMFKEFAVDKIQRIKDNFVDLAERIGDTVKDFTVEKITKLRDAAVDIMDRFDSIAVEQLERVKNSLREICEEVDILDTALGGVIETQRKLLDMFERISAMEIDQVKSMWAMYQGSLDPINQMLILYDSAMEVLSRPKISNILSTISKNFIAFNFDYFKDGVLASAKGISNLLIDLNKFKNYQMFSLMTGFLDPLLKADFSPAVKHSLIKAVVAFKTSIEKVSLEDAFKNFLNFETKVAFPGSKIVGFAKAVGKSLAINIGVTFAKNILVKMVKLTADARNLIERSLNDLSISDKFSSMFGDAGKEAYTMAFNLANEIGAEAGMIASKAEEAAFKGIGSKSFERIAKFSDKISKLSTGESFESVLDNMINNVKENHDAAGLSRLMGGGEVLERKLKRAGFERALNKGDLSKALDIAEKIAEESGLTDEKYQKASDTISANYTKIQNIIKNIKADLDEAMSGKFTEAVKKIREFFESDKFYKIYGFVKKIALMFTEDFVKGFEIITNNLYIIPAIALAGILGKSYLIVKSLKADWILLKKARELLIYISTQMGWQGMLRLLHAQNAQQKVLTEEQKKQIALRRKEFLITKGTAAIQLIGPWIILASVIVSAIHLADMFADKLREVTGYKKYRKLNFKGVFLAGLQFATNLFINVFTFFDRLVDRVVAFYYELKSGVRDVELYIMDTFNSAVAILIESLRNRVRGFVDEIFDMIDKIADRIIDALNPLSDITRQISSITGIEDPVKKALHERTAKARESFRDGTSGIISSVDDILYKIEKGLTLDTTKKENERAEYIEKSTARKEWMMDYIDNMNGYEEALETNGQSVLDRLSDTFNPMKDSLQSLVAFGKASFGEMLGIADNTDKIRKFNEQEEELRWLKTFSDRQIMSQYHNSTSNTKNVTFNGVSQNTMREGMRRNIATISSV